MSVLKSIRLTCYITAQCTKKLYNYNFTIFSHGYWNFKGFSHRLLIFIAFIFPDEIPTGIIWCRYGPLTLSPLKPVFNFFFSFEVLNAMAFSTYLLNKKELSLTKVDFRFCWVVNGCGLFKNTIFLCINDCFLSILTLVTLLLLSNINFAA